MAIPVWPSTLPQTPQKGYNISGGPNIIRSNMDAGPAKQRFRGNSVKKLNLSFIMTTEQVTLFETFVNTTLSGVLRFQFKDPKDSHLPLNSRSILEVRILPQADKSYDMEYLAPGYWRVSTQFEILP